MDGRFKLVIHDARPNDPTTELFDLEADPAEKTNLIERQSQLAGALQTRLRQWQQSVLHSLTGADYVVTR